MNPNIIPLFMDAAESLIEANDADPKKALCIALAYLSGHYKDAMSNRSLLTGQENCITMEIKLKHTFNGISFIWGILRKYLPQNI